MKDTSHAEGNPKLRAWSPLQARAHFRSELTASPELKDKYYRYLEDLQQIKAGMGSRFRAIGNNQRGGRE